MHFLKAFEFKPEEKPRLQDSELDRAHQVPDVDGLTVAKLIKIEHHKTLDIY